ncbi:MAG: pseudouridine synthase [Candidatus Shikimatogenerans bostrichidophilus]|nr:MAG: pseudouridine synthase [Candidatus Shikimatogenerans bostrichidophilus]
MENKLRLNNYISKCGICSRRKADNLIKLGLIKVNNKIINKLGYKIIENKDIIKYNNKVIKKKKKIYLLFNKPKNCITTTKEKKYINVMHYIPKIYKIYNLYPVGRLDKNTTGLLLITNDGKLSNKLTHPKYKIKKTYKIFLNKKIKKQDILKIKNGINLKEGKVKINNIIIKKSNKKSILLTINIGWNKIIHRIFNKLNYKVLNLDRINFAGLKKKKELKKGKFIILSKKIINYIKNINKI